jgi:hypothetical protein
MAQPYLLIVSIDAAPTDRGYTFTVNLDGPAGEARSPVSVDALMDYAMFQREILITTGQLFRYGVSEGRPAEAANEHFRTHIAFFLDAAKIRPSEAGPLVN